MVEGSKQFLIVILAEDLDLDTLPNELQIYLRTYTYIDARNYEEDLERIRKRIRFAMPGTPLEEIRRMQREAAAEGQAGEEEGVSHGAIEHECNEIEEEAMSESEGTESDMEDEEHDEESEEADDIQDTQQAHNVDIDDIPDITADTFDAPDEDVDVLHEKHETQYGENDTREADTSDRVPEDKAAAAAGTDEEEDEKPGMDGEDGWTDSDTTRLI